MGFQHTLVTKSPNRGDRATCRSCSSFKKQNTHIEKGRRLLYLARGRRHLAHRPHLRVGDVSDPLVSLGNNKRSVSTPSIESFLLKKRSRVSRSDKTKYEKKRILRESPKREREREKRRRNSNQVGGDGSLEEGEFRLGGQQRARRVIVHERVQQRERVHARVHVCVVLGIAVRRQERVERRREIGGGL